jgi:hypothetical protein
MTIETLVPDDLWQTIQPLLPPPPRRYGGRARVDDRACLPASSTSSTPASPGGCYPPSSLAAAARSPAGAAARLAARRRLATAPPPGPRPARPQRPARLVPRQSGPPQRPRQAWGVLTGPNPVDRGKPGSKYHLLVDRRGVPLAVVLSAANTHDSLLEQVVDAVPSIKGLRGRPGRPPKRPPKLHLDKATTTRAAGGRCVAVGSPRGSPGAVSSHAIGWAATATWWATGACRSATSGTPRCCSGFCIWRAR